MLKEINNEAMLEIVLWNTIKNMFDWLTFKIDVKWLGFPNFFLNTGAASFEIVEILLKTRSINDDSVF